MTHSGLNRLLALLRSFHPTPTPLGLARVLHAQMQARKQIKRQFAQALRLDQFELFYQPVVDIGSGGLLGFEGLIRWRHPYRGLLSPDEFIGLAEETGAIGSIGAWVLNQGCRDLAARERKDPDARAPWLSLNVSGEQFDGTLADTVKAALRRYGIDPCLLILEITEAVAITNLRAASDELSSLRSIGVRVALDDFGTGFSSLRSLDALPIDIIKIDRAFVSRGNPSGSMLEAIVTLGRTLGLQMIAEGIEEPGELERLRTLGVAAGQGFLFGRPLPAADTPGFGGVRRHTEHVEKELLLVGG